MAEPYNTNKVRLIGSTGQFVSANGLYDTIVVISPEKNFANPGETVKFYIQKIINVQITVTWNIYISKDFAPPTLLKTQSINPTFIGNTTSQKTYVEATIPDDGTKSIQMICFN